MKGHTSNNELRAAFKSKYQRAKAQRDRLPIDRSVGDYLQGQMDAVSEMAISLEIVDSREELESQS